MDCQTARNHSLHCSHLPPLESAVAGPTAEHWRVYLTERELEHQPLGYCSEVACIRAYTGHRRAHLYNFERGANEHWDNDSEDACIRDPLVIGALTDLNSGQQECANFRQRLIILRTIEWQLVMVIKYNKKMCYKVLV